MEIETTIVNGNPVKHKDVAHTNVGIRLDFWDCIKAFFGKTVHVKVQLYTMNDELLIVKSDSQVHVDALFPKKIKKGYGYAHQPEKENTHN